MKQLHRKKFEMDCGKKTYRKIFISGPMTGYENYNFPKFDAVEKALVGLGHGVFNPACVSRRYKAVEVLKHGAVFDRMIQEQLEGLKTCDAILLLKGWNNSNGAKRELKLALELGIDVILEHELS